MKKRAVIALSFALLSLIPIAAALRPVPIPPPPPLTPATEALLSILAMPCTTDCTEAIARLDAIEDLSIAGLPPQTSLLPLLPILDAWRIDGDAPALLRLAHLGQRLQSTSPNLSGYIIGQSTENDALADLAALPVGSLSGVERQALAALLTPSEATRPPAALTRTCQTMETTLLQQAADLRFLNRLLYRIDTATRFLRDRCDGVISHAAQGTPIPEDPNLELWNVVPWYVVSSLSDTAVEITPDLIEVTAALDTRRSALRARL